MRRHEVNINHITAIQSRTYKGSKYSESYCKRLKKHLPVLRKLVDDEEDKTDLQVIKECVVMIANICFDVLLEKIVDGYWIRFPGMHSIVLGAYTMKHGWNPDKEIRIEDIINNTEKYVSAEAIPVGILSDICNRKRVKIRVKPHKRYKSTIIRRFKNGHVYTYIYEKYSELHTAQRNTFRSGKKLQKPAVGRS